MLIRRSVMLACFIISIGGGFAQIVHSEHRSRGEIVTSQQLQALATLTTCDALCTDRDETR